MKNKKYISIISILFIFNLQANYFYKIDIKSQSSININNIINENINEVFDPLESENTNTEEDINIWAQYLQNNVRPYNGNGSHYDPTHPTIPEEEGYSSFSSNSSFYQEEPIEGGEEGFEEGECIEYCSSDIFSIEEIKSYMLTTGLVFEQVGNSEPMPQVTGLNNVIHRFEMQNSNITELSGIENITHVMDRVLFFNNNISDYSAFSNLKETERFEVVFSGGSFDFATLQNLEKGDVIFWDVPLYNLNLLNENLICKELNFVGANLSSINYSNLANIFSNGCTNINLDLNNITEVDVLSGITHFQRLDLGRNNLQNISGLSSIERVEESLNLDNNPSLSDLSPLSNLTYIGRDLTLEDTSITTLEGLNNLTSVGYLSLYEHDYLENLNGLENLITAGTIYLIRPPNLNNIDGLRNLTTIENRLALENIKVNDFSALSNLETVKWSMYISSPYATSLNGLENLRSVGSSLEVSGMPNLIDISALNNLESLGGKFHVDFRNMSGGKLNANHFICQDIANKVYFGYNVTPTPYQVSYVKSRICN